MGAVYRARRMLLGDEVALKIVRPDLTANFAGERFVRESRIAARLRHPAIVAIYDFDMPPDSAPYLVMELLSGPSLRDEIKARGRMDPADVRLMMPPICSALHLAHTNDVVHRDIKPANIVAHDYPGGTRVYKIVDFGVANLRETTDDTRLTSAHQFVGTVTYASPEQLTAGGVDARSDIYSLCIVDVRNDHRTCPVRGDRHARDRHGTPDANGAAAAQRPAGGAAVAGRCRSARAGEDPGGTLADDGGAGSRTRCWGRGRCRSLYASSLEFRPGRDVRDRGVARTRPARERSIPRIAPGARALR